MNNIIKLKNVSKFYYSKGIIASGFSKISLDFKLGEFVAITGESGSGKSTLLNVISGLDSYEEGELYINGEETSHYTEKDFENYRRKYIGNIFQNFNLVNSYTVYQNIELVLLLNGNKHKNIKKKVLELIKTVDLYHFRNTKVSKLSGGQKQRVAIARALAKETSIIIADEPTGNLDSKSAESIIKLLSKIAENKLVIVVTHNYEKVEPYVTRKIKMHDGKILEDKEIRKIKDIEDGEVPQYKNITFLNKIRLGLRNTFNIVPKFLLVLAVYLFITVALISEYASFKQDEYNASKEGYNYYFRNLDDSRVILQKNDKSVFTDEDYEKIGKTENIKSIFKNDLLLDKDVNITDRENFWLYGQVLPNDMIDSVDKGRLPENDNEVIVMGNKDDYYVGSQAEELLNKEMFLENITTGEINGNNKLVVVGIKYDDKQYNYNYTIYLSESIINILKFQINQEYSKVEVGFMSAYYESNYYNPQYNVIASDRVPQGYAYITEDNNYLCPREYCINQGISVNVKNLYYNDILNLTVLKTYNKNNYNSLLGLSKDNFDINNGTIYISTTDYDGLFNKGNYQSSIFVDDVKIIDETITNLNNAGYKTLAMKDVLVSGDYIQAIKILKAVVTIVLIVVLFFVSYFVIRIILKSRNIYFSIIRMLGATKNISKQLLIIELLAVSNLAYFAFMIIIYLNYLGIYNIKFIDTIINYLNFSDYIVLYIILTAMSYLVSEKFSKKLFKNTAVKTIKEEV